MFKTPLIKAIRGFLSYFSNPVNEFPLTYRSELIDEDSVLFSVGGANMGGGPAPLTNCRCFQGRFISTNPITRYTLPTGPI